MINNQTRIIVDLDRRDDLAQSRGLFGIILFKIVIFISPIHERFHIQCTYFCNDSLLRNCAYSTERKKIFCLIDDRFAEPTRSRLFVIYQQTRLPFKYEIEYPITFGLLETVNLLNKSVRFIRVQML